ncbi:FKBP-type peptidyl-prolyl cis-trans isomerase [Niabella sp. CJ426]|jgi:FKBP-type peptidyl-prolyl cis-trans isomerase FkpA|uniref:FKBP-type peptidyl-prolyl cis-trans isomerase n=1 Tax=Niabella sp. CJ426 TaxID=3393740 RepID=UPI003CFFEC49
MKKIIFFLGVVTAFAAVGCLKNNDDDYKPCTPKTVESELPAMAKFATDSSISTTTDATGLLYQIIEPGTGSTPNANSSVVAKYVGRFMDGKGFDSSYVRSPQGATFRLNEVISGWTIGIPKIKVGGKIKLIIPSSLAYGCGSPYAFLNNQPLYFYVELVSVN